MKNANAIIIDNFPPNYNHLMLRELIVNYPGVDDMQFNGQNQQAYVKFKTTDEAKLALSGNYINCYNELFIRIEQI